MTSLHVCFSKYPVKSQPEVGLSQEFLDFGQLGHDLTGPSTSIPIPPNAIPSNAIDYRTELDTFDLTSFGSFSSAAESLVHDHAIVIPAYSPPSTPATSTQDFCLLDDQQDELGQTAPSSQFDSEFRPQDIPSSLLSASPAYDQDTSTPLTSMLSPYGFYMDDTMMMPSPSSPGSWLANSLYAGLSIQSPSPSLISGTDSTTSAHLTDQLQPPQQHQEQQVCYASSYSSTSTISQVLTPSPQQHYYDTTGRNTMDRPLQTGDQGTAKDDHEHLKMDAETTNTFIVFQHESKTSPPKKPQQARRREYHCPHCHRKSNRSNNMKEHILTHDPNRPKNFPCALCPKRFARKHDLKRHHQSHERNIEKMMVACGLVPGLSSFP